MPTPEHAVDLFVLLLLIAFPVAVLVRFVRMPYTVALVLAGLGIAFIPGMPEMKLSPELVFAVILPGVGICTVYLKPGLWRPPKTSVCLPVWVAAFPRVAPQRAGRFRPPPAEVPPT